MAEIGCAEVSAVERCEVSGTGQTSWFNWVRNGVVRRSRKPEELVSRFERETVDAAGQARSFKMQREDSTGE
jgi:hypothetical protein